MIHTEMKTLIYILLFYLPSLPANKLNVLHVMYIFLRVEKHDTSAGALHK